MVDMTHSSVGGWRNTIVTSPVLIPAIPTWPGTSDTLARNTIFISLALHFIHKSMEYVVLPTVLKVGDTAATFRKSIL